MVKIGILPDLKNLTEYKGKLQYTMKEDNKRPKPRNIILAENWRICRYEFDEGGWKNAKAFKQCTKHG